MVLLAQGRIYKFAPPPPLNTSVYWQSHRVANQALCYTSYEIPIIAYATYILYYAYKSNISKIINK